MSNDTRYVEPGWFTRHIFNGAVRGLARIGVSVAGSRELRVRGRKSGQWRATPVNLMTVGAERYLVAPRGHTQWVRNIRVAGAGELRLGWRKQPFRAVEVEDGAKTPILREYVRRWSWEAGQFLNGIDKAATDEQLAQVAPDFPVFRVETAVEPPVETLAS